MPRKLRPDDTVQGWRVLHEIHVGPLAMSYAALNPMGTKAFLKLYKSPTRTVVWYRGFMAHQLRLAERIDAGPSRAFTVRRFDGFEAEFGSAAVAYFQAFEFVEGGKDLESVTAQIRSGAPSVNWNQRVLMAKVLMAGVNALHLSGVVHGDLKPANVQIFEDASITAGYRLKLIDLDYAVMPDVLSPWHGQQGYVGTPGYYSPEHLVGRAPIPASDVFTCGIMLHELLTDHGNPFRLMADEDYRRATGEWRAPKPILAGQINGTTRAEVPNIIHQCLHPDPEHRPTAAEVHAVLNGAHKSPAKTNPRGRAAVSSTTAPAAKVQTGAGGQEAGKGGKRSASVTTKASKPRAGRQTGKPAATGAVVTLMGETPPVRPMFQAPVAPPLPPAVVLQNTPARTPSGPGVLILANAQDRTRRLGFRLRIRQSGR
jgi:serine/threonine protein kinase